MVLVGVEPELTMDFFFKIFFFPLPEHLLSLCSSPPARGQRCSAAECVLFVCVLSLSTVRRVSWIHVQCVSCCFHLYHACIYRERVRWRCIIYIPV